LTLLHIKATNTKNKNKEKNKNEKKKNSKNNEEEKLEPPWCRPSNHCFFFLFI